MTKYTSKPTKPRQGAFFGQSGPSAAKRQAVADRYRDTLATRNSCVACPYARDGDARCAWVCATARDTHTHDTRDA